MLEKTYPFPAIARQHYEWRGLRQSRGLRSKTRRVITQFSPHDFTAFNWEGTTSFFHYVTVVLLLAVFLAAELNPFYLKVRGQKLGLDFNETKYLFRVCFGWSPVTR